MPFLSVIIPVYNVEKYIEACLESVISQSYSDFEIICVNDGSTDNSLHLLEKYRTRDSRIKIINQNNKGVSEARNRGLREAAGDYVCFVDSDDLLTADALAALRKCIEENPSVQAVVYEVRNLIYENQGLRNITKESYYKINGKHDGRIRTGRELFVELINNNDYIDSVWLLALERVWLEENNIRFVPGVLFEDSWFCLECYFNADRMCYLDKVLYIYRVRENSIMTQKNAVRHAEWRLRQYENCLRYIFTKAENEEEIKALEKYSGQILENIQYLFGKICAADRVRITENNPVGRLILKNMQSDYMYDSNRMLRLEGILGNIEKADRVLLYGAGNVGEKLMKLLSMRQLENKVVGFALSSAPGKDTYKQGKPVKQISAYKNDNIELVIISSCGYHEDMLKQTGLLDNVRVLLIDMEIEGEIDYMIEQGGCV